MIAAVLAVAIPYVVLTSVRVAASLRDEAGWYSVQEVAAYTLFVVVPLALISARRPRVSFASMLTAWLSVGLVVGVLWRVVYVGVAWFRGDASYPFAELMQESRPYFVGWAVSDAVLLSAIAAIVWFYAIWDPRSSKRSWIHDSIVSRGAIAVAAVRTVSAALVASALVALVNVFSMIIIRLAVGLD